MGNIIWCCKKHRTEKARVGNMPDVTLRVNKGGSNAGKERYALVVRMHGKATEIIKEYAIVGYDVENEKFFIANSDENNGYKVQKKKQGGSAYFTKAIDNEEKAWLEPRTGGYMLEEVEKGVYSISLSVKR